MDVDQICREAEEWVKGRGVEVRRRQFSYAKGSHLSANDRLKRMWIMTDTSKGLLKRGAGGVVIKNNRRGTARGGSRWGIYIPYNHAYIMDTIIHEIAHVVHLWNFYESRINGVRRPHDLLYNRIMLKMMQAYCGLSEQDCNPIRWGWGVGEGYAPTRRIDELHRKLVDEKHPKIMRWFK